MKYRLYTDTEKSWETGHEKNEDRYIFSEFSFMGDQSMQLIVIADGMGGMSDGDQAAQNAVRGFAGSFYSSVMSSYAGSEMRGFSVRYAVKDIEDAMITAVKEANKAVCEYAGPYYESGTTLSAVCIAGDFAVIANVGDSPVYYYNSVKRKLRLVSELHTKAEQDVRAGLYPRFSDKYYMNDSRLYNYIGQYDDLETDSISITSVGNLKNGDIILAGSDGAFGRIRDNVIYGLIADCSTEEEGFVLDQLFELARMDGFDDQTAVMYVAEDEE